MDADFHRVQTSIFSVMSSVEDSVSPMSPSFGLRWQDCEENFFRKLGYRAKVIRFQRMERMGISDIAGKAAREAVEPSGSEPSQMKQTRMRDIASKAAMVGG